MRVAVLRPAHADAEAQAAARWAGAQGWSVVELSLDRLAGDTFEEIDVCWCHAASQVPAFGPPGETALEAFVRRGGRMVLSLLATPMALSIGGTGAPPEMEVQRPWRNADDPRWPDAFRDWPGYPHIRGFQGWGAHPLFAGLQGGTFSWTATEGEPVSRAVYVRPAWPEARVIAVDRSYVHLDADTAVAWEYDVGAGRITCLGANIAFGAANHALDAQRDAIVRNALAPAREAARTWWPMAVKRHAAVTPVPRPRALGSHGERPDIPGRTQAPPLDVPVTLGAPGGLLVASMAHGVQEVWLHPLCVLGGGIDVQAEHPLRAVEATASSVHVTRTLESVSGFSCREDAFLHARASEFVYVLSPLGAHTSPMGVEFRVPLRRQWPYPADALAPIRTELREEGPRKVVLLTGRDGAHVAACFVDGAAEVTIAGDDTESLVRVRSLPGAPLRVLVRASSSGSRDLVPETHDTWAALRERVATLDALHARTVQLASSDTALNASWRDAIERLEHFVVAAPGGGRGLMAGYAGTRAGWNISRPGYAWFFGRDACWTIEALLAAGMFDEARDAISLLARTMDVTGKVIHEFTTSGVAHYDAADSTPLFLRAVGVYAAWTGDLASLRQWWPSVLRAFAFVLTCDRDDDGLPENTGVGHGWIEMGPLGGGALTSYVAAAWIDALRRLVPVAAHLGDHATQLAFARALTFAERGLEALRGPDGTLALHRDVFGRLSQERTAMAAVPIALNIDTSLSNHELLEDLASPRFSAPWGLRMLPNDDPRYDPVAYHAGSAWPLFTGWAALADCAVGDAARGLSRVQGLARFAQADGTGGFAEVLNGDTGARGGVCPDQAWSAAMIVSPLVHGVGGLVPDALHRRAALRGHMPTRDFTLRLEGLRIGDTRLDVQWSPVGGGTALAATHRAGPAIDLSLDDIGDSPATCADGNTVHFTAPDAFAIFDTGAS